MGGKRCALHAIMYDPGFDHRDARSIGHSPVIDRTDDDYRRRWNLDQRRIALGQIDTQALQARARRLRAGIVDADVRTAE